jgi:hypothetical protein
MNADRRPLSDPPSASTSRAGAGSADPALARGGDGAAGGDASPSAASPSMHRRCEIYALDVLEGPEVVLRKLKAAGFEFLSETCPIKIRPPFSQEQTIGGFIFRQWGKQ